MSHLFADYLKRFESVTNPYTEFFTNLDYNDLSKLPYMYEVENFCLRVYKAFKLNEKICIYSDYDTDAVTATGVMYKGLLNLGINPENLDFYAPDRFIEGYGINPSAIEDLAQKYD